MESDLNQSRNLTTQIFLNQCDHIEYLLIAVCKQIEFKTLFFFLLTILRYFKNWIVYFTKFQVTLFVHCQDALPLPLQICIQIGTMYPNFIAVYWSIVTLTMTGDLHAENMRDIVWYRLHVQLRFNIIHRWKHDVGYKNMFVI